MWLVVLLLIFIFRLQGSTHLLPRCPNPSDGCHPPHLASLLFPHRVFPLKVILGQVGILHVCSSLLRLHVFLVPSTRQRNCMLAVTPLMLAWAAPHSLVESWLSVWLPEAAKSGRPHAAPCPSYGCARDSRTCDSTPQLWELTGPVKTQGGKSDLGAPGSASAWRVRCRISLLALCPSSLLGEEVNIVNS